MLSTQSHGEGFHDVYTYESFHLGKQHRVDLYNSRSVFTPHHSDSIHITWQRKEMRRQFTEIPS